MLHDAYWLSATDATPLFVNHWAPGPAPRAAVMLAHGMAEHSGRYARLGEALAAIGISLYALDLRGHGRTAEHGTLGHYADSDGWSKVIGDLATLNHHIRQQLPHVPIVLFAHSMGTYIGQAYLMQHSCSLQAAILSGSNYQPEALYRAAEWIARAERWRLGPTGRSKLLNFLSFGSFNKAFKPNRSEFDWLSRDTAEVDRYINDPLCGFICTTQLWIDLLGGLQQITPTDNLAQIENDLPILVVGGERDPVSQGKRLRDLAEALRRAGLTDVELKIYADGRHELLNESNRDEVTAYLTHWLEQALTRPRQCPPPQQEPA